MEIKNKVAVVTGAAKGIGRGIAIEFAREGGKIVVADIDKKGADETVRNIADEGLEATSVHADVTKLENARMLVKASIDRFGKIDILVNNVGIYPVTLLIDMDEREWDRVIDVDLKTVFNCTKAAIPFMIAQKSGRIVNIASVTGHMVGYVGQTHYAAAKSGIIGFTRSLALELAKYNINVNAVAPGTVETPEMEFCKFADSNPLGRLGSPKDVADVALFLASDRSSYITGQVIVVDGGNIIQELKV